MPLPVSRTYTEQLGFRQKDTHTRTWSVFLTNVNISCLNLSGLPMKTGGGDGDRPPSVAVAHSDEFCRISAGSVPPGKLAHTSQNCPLPLTTT